MALDDPFKLSTDLGMMKNLWLKVLVGVMAVTSGGLVIACVYSIYEPLSKCDNSLNCSVYSIAAVSVGIFVLSIPIIIILLVMELLIRYFSQ